MATPDTKIDVEFPIPAWAVRQHSACGQLTMDGPTILANAHRIAPLLREHADQVEAARRLTKPVVDALRGSGVFRMSMPRSRGGPQVDLLTQVEILEVLSRADASAGWCAMIGSDSGYYSAFLSDADGGELYPDLDAVTAGWINPVGTLEAAEGGYRLSGRWSFGSGSTHADVIAAGALVTDAGVPRLGPDGQPDWRIALVPASRVEVHETWHTTGLCGTGSNDYSTDAVLVPPSHTFSFTQTQTQCDGTLYRWPALFMANSVAVPLGVATDALDVAMDILAGKSTMPDMIPVRDEARVRVAVARAQALVGSSRSYAYDTLGAFWAVLETGDEPSFAARARLAGCFVYTMSTCREAVQLLVDTVGTAAIQRGSSLERNLRDLITMSQHILGQVKMQEWAGGLWFGQPAPIPLL
jgi:alkylation response protein AidB-like acyl-CoA dehydrogenase